MITPPLTKFTLSDPSDPAQELDVTGNTGSWSDLEIIYDRDGTTGVLAEASFPMTFHLEAMDYLKKLFDRDGLYARATLRIYRRDDFRLDRYTLVKAMELDFATYKEGRQQVEIDSINSELSVYLNSGAKTKYDIPVNGEAGKNDGIAETKKWRYDSLTMRNGCSFTLPEGPEFRIGLRADHLSYCSFFMNRDANSTEMSPGSPGHIFQNETSIGFSEYYPDKEGPYFFEAAEACTIILEIDATFRTNAKYLSTLVRKVKANRVMETVFAVGGNRTQEGSEYVDKQAGRTEVTMGRGEKLVLLALVQNPTGGPDVRDPWVQVDECAKFTLNYYAQAAPRDKDGNAKPWILDVIRPERLLQKFLDLISEKGMFTGEIHWDGLYPVAPMICAAESIRGFEKAALHGSLGDFMEWMHTLGYEYEISGRKMVYRPRKAFFQRKTALTLTEDQVADLHTEASDEYAYTGVKIGYDKQDYESMNGRFEANGMFEYSTGYIRREKNVLELESPYRADSIGIELLCWQRDKRTTDDKADKDVFFVALDENTSDYTTFRGFELVQEQVRMFNAPYCPYFLAKANAGLIGINARTDPASNSGRLRFTSTDASREVRIEGNVPGIPGNGIFNDIELPRQEKLFDPVIYNFASGNSVALPDESGRNGLICFTFDGVPRRGFIRKISKNYSRDTETTWELLAVREGEVQQAQARTNV